MTPITLIGAALRLIKKLYLIKILYRTVHRSFSGEKILGIIKVSIIK